MISAPRRRIVLALLGTLTAVLVDATLLAAADLPRPRAAHVVLISVDGLRPEFYLDPSYAAPMLRQLAASGAHAEGMLGVFPTVTYPSHTTLITGVRPARHGIFYNAPFEPAGPTGRWYWEAAAIKVPTLFSAARAAGLKTASIGWPVTVGGPIDWNVPEIWSLEKNADPIAVIRAACQPPELLAELEREATGRLRKENFTFDYQGRDDRAGAIVAYLLVQYRPALLALHLTGTDHFQHEDGRDGAGIGPKTGGARVRRAVASADRAIAQIYEAAETAGLLDRVTFVIVGDHGMSDRHTLLAPNVALVAAGLRTAANDRGPRWRATFHTSAASAFLHLADPSDHAAAKLARAALDKLPSSVRALYRIVDRPELDQLGAAPEAAFALAPRPGVDFTDSPTAPLLQPAQGAAHGYLPDEPQLATGFVAAGAGIRPGAATHHLQMVDVAPLVATLLGLPLPDTEGTPPLGFLTPEPGPDSPK